MFQMKCVYIEKRSVCILKCVILVLLCVPQLPDGVELTLSELREMAGRQQQQIDDHQQQLVAKEQRLKYLKQQVGLSQAPDVLRDFGLSALRCPKSQSRGC